MLPGRHRPSAQPARRQERRPSPSGAPAMKLKSWLHALKAGPPRRPIRRTEPRGRRRDSAAGKLFVENLEDRTVPTFLAPVDYPVGAYPVAVVSGLFNNDTIPDLAVANQSGNTVSVL